MPAARGIWLPSAPGAGVAVAPPVQDGQVVRPRCELAEGRFEGVASKVDRAPVRFAVMVVRVGQLNPQRQSGAGAGMCEVPLALDE